MCFNKHVSLATTMTRNVSAWPPGCREIGPQAGLHGGGPQVPQRVAGPGPGARGRGCHGPGRPGGTLGHSSERPSGKELAG